MGYIPTQDIFRMNEAEKQTGCTARSHILAETNTLPGKQFISLFSINAFSTGHLCSLSTYPHYINRKHIYIYMYLCFL